MEKYTGSVHASKQTQTAPQPVPPPVCVPLMMVDKDGKKQYCYHGGKCRCELCKIIRQQQQEEIDRNLDTFLSHPRLQLAPAIRQVKQKPYTPVAWYVSPQFGQMLLKEHLRLTREILIYYLPDKYYVKDGWSVVGPQDVGTQTEIRIGNYGVENCPCPNKTVCWDI